jgi:hypothetical protein
VVRFGPALGKAKSNQSEWATGLGTRPAGPATAGGICLHLSVCCREGICFHHLCVLQGRSGSCPSAAPPASAQAAALASSRVSTRGLDTRDVVARGRRLGWGPVTGPEPGRPGAGPAGVLPGRLLPSGLRCSRPSPLCLEKTRLCLPQGRAASPCGKQRTRLSWRPSPLPPGDGLRRLVCVGPFPAGGGPRSLPLENWLGR